MGIFDKLLGRGQDQSREKALSEVPKAVLPQETSDIEKAIAEKASHLSEYKKFRWVKSRHWVAFLPSFLLL